MTKAFFKSITMPFLWIITIALLLTSCEKDKEIKFILASQGIVFDSDNVNVSVPANGLKYYISVWTSESVFWEAQIEDGYFLDIEPAGERYGSNDFTINVAGNGLDETRTAKVIVTRKDTKEKITITFTQDTKSLPRFAVISDLHFGRADAIEKVTKSLMLITERIPTVNAIFVVGDITDASLADNYDDALKVFKDNAKGIPVYYTMGNHDRTFDQNGELFKEKTTQDVYQYIEIKNYPFVTVSVQGGVTVTHGDQCYSEEAKTFLSEKMAFAANKFPNKPIFAFYHTPVANTVWGSEPEVMGSEVLAPVMNLYPQAIAFSGHTHYSIVDDRSIHQNKFTTVNDGGGNYGRVPFGLEDGVMPEGSKDVTEALIVTVKSNGDVDIERISTFRDENIKTPWVIKAPHNGSQFVYTESRTGAEVPKFKDNAKVLVSEIDNSSCVISIPQATDDNGVYSYLIDVKDNTNQSVLSYSILSREWNGSNMPDPLNWKIKKLSASTSYHVIVQAEDSFGQRSSNILSDTFTTTSL